MSENLKRNSTQNSNPNNSLENSAKGDFDIPKKKKNRIGIKKEDEMMPAFIANSNEVIYFKIIHSEDEFINFQNLSNLEYCFNPQFTNQIFENETITGYKNLKILISLTPRLLFPHFKVIYDSSLKVKDDIELILKNHYGQIYEKDDAKFLEKLKEENNCQNSLVQHPPKGNLICEEELNGENFIINVVDIIKDNFTEENFNYQCLCTFFIDGASFIPYVDNFWSYFILYQKIQFNKEECENKFRYEVIGFTSTLNVNLSLAAHRSMVSQFLIIPPFQRRGLGHFLLDVIILIINSKFFK